MKTVYKYRIPIADIFQIDLPQEAEILHVAEQNGVPHMWALVDPDAPKTRREFRFAGTGHPIHEGNSEKHIGTFFMEKGSLVFHIFETKQSLYNARKHSKSRGVEVP